LAIGTGTNPRAARSPTSRASLPFDRRPTITAFIGTSPADLPPHAEVVGPIFPRADRHASPDERLEIPRPGPPRVGRPPRRGTPAPRLVRVRAPGVAKAPGDPPEGHRRG